MINTVIANGQLPGPNDQRELVYVVFVPNGVQQATNFAEQSVCNTSNNVYGGYGQHQQCVGAQCACPNGTCPNTDTFYWVRVTNGAAINALPTTITAGISATLTLSHELAEAITNPTVANSGGVTVTPPSPSGNEIGDACACFVKGSNTNVQGVWETFDGYAVQAYWSQADQKCVVPEGYSDTWRYAGSPNNWSLLTTNPVRQATAGTTNASGAELLVEDSSRNVWAWVTQQQAWALLPAPPGGAAMFAVTQYGPWVLSSDASAVYQYDGSTWQNLAFPNAPITSIVGGGVPVVTDLYGQIWKYTGSGWTVIKGAPGYWADKLISNGQTLYMLAANRSLSLYSGGSWSSWNGYYQDIFTGGAGSTEVIATKYDPSNLVLVTSPNSTTVIDQLGPSFLPHTLTFAMDDSNGIWAIGSGSLQNPIYKSTNPNVPNSGWTTEASIGARMIGQGDTMYVVNNITY